VFSVVLAQLLHIAKVPTTVERVTEQEKLKRALTPRTVEQETSFLIWAALLPTTRAQLLQNKGLEGEKAIAPADVPKARPRVSRP
jgi:hypothetical protein